MGKAYNHTIEIVFKRDVFDSLLDRRDWKYIDLHGYLVTKYKIGLGYKSFMNLIGDRVEWRLLYAYIFCEFFDVGLNDLFEVRQIKKADADTITNDMEVHEQPIRNQVKFFRVARKYVLVSKLKLLYKDKCQVCGTSINISNTKRYSECHHLKPLGHPHNGVDNLNNMIVVCPNHHKMFDKGAIAIHPITNQIYVFEGNNYKEATDLSFYLNKEKHSIKKEFFDYHWNNIFLPNIESAKKVYKLRKRKVGVYNGV